GSTGAATWALAQTGTGLSASTTITGVSTVLNSKTLADLPGILANQVIPTGIKAGAMYWNFAHTEGGYTEDTGMGMMGLGAAWSFNPSLNYTTAINNAQLAQTGAVDVTGVVYPEIVAPHTSPMNLFAGRLLEGMPSEFTSWNVNSDGTWSAATNWKGTAPSVVGSGALFGSVISAPHQVTLGSAATVSRLTFSSASAYTIGGSSTLTFDTATGSPSINVILGSHSISAPVTLAKNTTI